jgi:glucose-1-phosphate adenylyltransferase
MGIMSQTLTIILAGGRGDRLFPISAGKAKPLVSFGGAFCILDFTLSNCVNSDIERAYLLTQYKSESIKRYVEASLWKTDLMCLPPRFANGYRGTANSVYQNLNLLRGAGVKHVLVLAADHIYKMDYGRLVRFHAEHGGSATIAAVRYPGCLASEMGHLETDARGQVTRFEEKPGAYEQRNGTDVLASMGVYVFEPAALHMALLRDEGDFTSGHDFGRDVLPKLIRSDRVFAYDFTVSDPGLGNYWRDVGTIDSYYAAQMELLMTNSPFDPHCDPRWPIHAGGRPAASCLVADRERGIFDSVISRSVKVAAGAHIEKAILMSGARVGTGAKIRRAIVCEGVTIPDGETIGFDAAEDRNRFLVTQNGVVVVHPGHAARLRSENTLVRSAKAA